MTFGVVAPYAGRRGLRVVSLDADRHPAAYRSEPGEDVSAARTRAGTFVLDAYQRRGLAMPDTSTLGQLIERAVERMSPTERRSGHVPADVISYIHAEVAKATGTENRPVNITSAEFARMANDQNFRHNFGLAGDLLLAGAVAGLGRGGVGTDTGMRGTGLPGHISPEVRSAQSLIINTYQMPWVANDPGLIALGPQGMLHAARVLREANVREEVYSRARAAGISASTAVKIAEKAKKAGRDANEDIKAVTDAIDAAAAGRPAPEGARIRREMDSELARYYADVDRANRENNPQLRADAQRRLEEQWRGRAAGGTPEAREKIERGLEVIRSHTERDVANNTRDATNIARNDVATNIANNVTNNLTDLYGPAPANPVRADAVVPPANGTVVAANPTAVPNGGTVVAPAPAPAANPGNKPGETRVATAPAPTPAAAPRPA